MTDAVLDFAVLAPDDWRVLRTTRLRALLDSPRAFTARYATERGWTGGQWQERLRREEWTIARLRSEVAGIACLEAPPAGAGEPRHVESVWVAPEQRRRGVLRSIVDTLADRGMRTGSSALLLWVLEDNSDALAAYRSVGFVPTWERQEVEPCRFEVRLCRTLRSSANGFPSQRTE